MPELASLPRSGVNFPGANFPQVNGEVRYAPPVASTEAQSTAMAFATLAESLGKLPEAMVTAYEDGRQSKRMQLAEEQIDSRIKSGDLTDLTIESGPKGTSVALNKQDPYGELKAMVAAQNLANSQRGPQAYQNLKNRATGGAPGAPGAPRQVGPATEPPLPEPGPLSAMGAEPGGLRNPDPNMSSANAAAIAPSGSLEMMGSPDPRAVTDPIVAGAGAQPGSMEGMAATPPTPAGPILDENTGLIFVDDALGRKVSIDPTGKVEVISKDGVKEKKGFVFNTVGEANAFAEKNKFTAPKIKQEGGKLVVDEFTPQEADSKGKVKLTDSTRKDIASSATLIADLDGLEHTQEKLYNEDKAGPIAGRLESFKAKLGFGDAEYVGAQGQIDVGQFKIARLLNGPGVLTDKDITRAQAVAPTLNETPASFKAKMTQVRRMLRESIEVWKQINGASASPDQLLLVDKSLEALGGTPGAGKPAPQATPANPSVDLEAELAKRQALIDSGKKANGQPLTPRERAAAQLLLDRERAKLKSSPKTGEVKTMGSVLG